MHRRNTKTYENGVDWLLSFFKLFVAKNIDEVLFEKLNFHERLRQELQE